MNRLQNAKTILVTGGLGFIGSQFIRQLLKNNIFTGRVINVDAMTYAANPYFNEEMKGYGERYLFEKIDLVDSQTVLKLFEGNTIDIVVHFAAESHVDRSILEPGKFIQSNVIGTLNLLNASRQQMDKGNPIHFHHISTDEVFGSLGASGLFREDTAYDPRSPYSASKAASDHLVQAWHHTYGLPITLSNCSNNYGPWQFPEKLIPVMILNMLEGKNLPVYGEGKNVRDWLHVADHCSAILTILEKAETGSTWNIGGEEEWSNIDLIHKLMENVSAQTGKAKAEYEKLITYVTDRKGHDFRYAIDCSKIKSELSWEQSYDINGGLEETVRFYIEEKDWLLKIRSGEYKEWMTKNYGER